LLENLLEVEGLVSASHANTSFFGFEDQEFAEVRWKANKVNARHHQIG